MSAFADDCREKSARYVERAAGYRMAGDQYLTNLARQAAMNLSAAASAMEAIDRSQPDAAERLQG